MVLVILVGLLGCGTPTPPCGTGVLGAASVPCQCGASAVATLEAPPATCACEGGAVSCLQPPADDPSSPDLPTPFSAEQIRQGMPQGVVIRLETSAPSGVLSRDEWSVVASDAAGVEIRYTSFSGEGKAIGGSEQKRDTWAALQDHARFPRERATRERATFTSALGTFEGWKYVVTEADDAGSVRTSTYWFADALPGAPLRMVVADGAVEVVRMEQVSRKGT